MKKVVIKQVTKTEFELEDGTIFQHPFELEEVPTVEEFQAIYDHWQKVMETESE